MAVTLLNLRDGSKELADKVSDASVSDTTWNVWINQAIERLWAAVINAFSDHAFNVFDFTLSSGNTQSLSALSPGFRRIRGLELNPGQATRTMLRSFNWQERDRNVWPYVRATWDMQRSYRLMGATLYIEPQEVASGSYRLYYVPAPTVLTVDGSTLDTYLEPWAELVMVLAAIKGLGKEESDTSDLLRREQELLAEIEASAEARDIGSPDTVTDVT